MGIHNLDKLFGPKSIAVIGASEKPERIGTALVAIDESVTPEIMLGVARRIGDPDLSETEFSIMIGDPWQGQGVGAKLLLNLLKVAKKPGAEKVWGTVLRENTHMVQLGKKCGFAIKFNSEEDAYDLNIDLSQALLEE